MRILLLLSLLLSLSACFLTKKKKVVDVKPPVEIVEKTIQDTSFQRLLFSNNNIDTSKIEIAYQYYLKPKEIWQDSINKHVANFIFGNSYFEIPDNVKIICNDSAFAACIDTFTSYAKQDYQDSEFGMLWEMDLKTSINEEFETFATLGLGLYMFSGGAHGNTYYGHINIDKSNGKTLELKDFISDTTEFNRIAEICFRKQNEISETEILSDLGFWFPTNQFSCNNNFYISNEGFNFIFNTYEVAPYSHGTFEFSVPFTLSKELLKIDLSKK